MEAFAELGKIPSPIEGLLVYVPARPPISDEEKQTDPFSIYGAVGSIFPKGDGDEFLSICLKAKPDYSTQIRRVFWENPSPSFEVIDAIGGSGGWPILQAALGQESARNIIMALLAPKDSQQKALKKNEGWLQEVRDILRTSLGLNLLSNIPSPEAVSEELWRFLLFNEFAFDLEQEMPEVLSGVPRAALEARALVEDICDALRSDVRTQPIYIERAESIEKGLNLASACNGIEAFGGKDTFPFEERFALLRAMDSMARDDIDSVRSILKTRRSSIWTGRGESRAKWDLIDVGVSLIEACELHGSRVTEKSRSLESLMEFYINGLREVDRLHREFEQAAIECMLLMDESSDAIRIPRKAYKSLSEKLQELFISRFEKGFWPPAGFISNGDVFDKVVAPKLKEGNGRVAFIMVDALRYELGLALKNQLMEDNPATLSASCAQLPTITEVGMASLLPGASHSLRLTKKDEDELSLLLDDEPLPNVNYRMNLLKNKYGQRFAEMDMGAFVSDKNPVDPTVDLLVLRAPDMDQQFEKNAEMAFRSVTEIFRRIRYSIYKLRQLGFTDVVIATDHGFAINMAVGAGDKCVKPQGKAINIHDRCLLGTITPDANNFAIPVEQAGVRGDFQHLAGPRGLVAYREGVNYMHGGVSLQECILPVLTLKLEGAGPETVTAGAVIKLSYKNGAKRITTRLPVIDVTLEKQDLFSQGYGVEIRLEARDKKGALVGEAKTGGQVNPATGTVLLESGIQSVTIRMDSEFEGRFTLKALNPTNLTEYCRLDLETDYVV